MKRSIIVTDLTRFSNPDIVCTAGMDQRNGECIRPVPYLRTALCEELHILPGAILTGEFVPERHLKGPHQEDYRYYNLTCIGSCDSAEFRTALEKGLFDGVEAGFETEIAEKEKHIPFGQSVQRSLITIALNPRDVEIVEDSYHPGKIKINFTDQQGKAYRNIGITDLGFHDYALEHHNRNELAALNRWLRLQDAVLLRVGLSRRFKPSDGRDGYWMQVNGIYTFPIGHREIRSQYSL